MPKMSNIAMLKKGEQPTLSIRVKTSVDQLPRLIGECYAKLGAYLQEEKEMLSDIPFVAYHNMDMQNLDVEIGFPVAKVMAGKDDIQANIIPGGLVIACMYRGPYSEIEPLYAEMAEYLREKQLEPVGTAYEYYYNDLSFPESELLTNVVMPLK